ncbi:MAG: antiterminator LoaP [Clostridia bacterium]|nr:antiterminator LoaP [Clostridia bacterium]
MEWYALFVESGKEEEVQKWLDFHFDKETLCSLIPKRCLREKKRGISYRVCKKLFPGYVFIQTDMDFNKYKVIKKIPGLIRVLNTGTYYSQINPDEMSLILRLLGDNAVIDLSRIFVLNSKILVKDGPLYGMEGLIKKLNKHTNRAKVQLNFMNEPRMVDLGIEILHKVD